MRDDVIAQEMKSLLTDDKEKQQQQSVKVLDRFYKDGTSVMVFLDRGFIFVGRLYQESDTIFRLESSSNCRSQSTGKGWGYVAKMGMEYCVIDEYLSSPIKFSKSEIKLVTEIDEFVWSMKS